MFEEAIPSAVSYTMNNLFSPAILFFLLNLMIASIAISSKLSRRSSSNGIEDHHETTEQNHHHQQQQEGGEGGGGGEERNPPSNSSYYEPPTEPLSRSPSVSGRFRPSGFHGQGRGTAEPEQEAEERHDGSYEEIYRNLKAKDPRRKRPEREGPTRMRRSWSMRSDFEDHHRGESSGGGGEREDGAEVERRRPATTREWREGDEAGVDARADDFINRFKQQLKLQRLESFSKYRTMIGLGSKK